MNICIYGSGSSKISEKYLNEGYKLGLKIANEKHTLVFGGGANGMMGAVAQGVLKNNGKIIGIAPSWINEFEDLFKSCSKFIDVNSMNERKNEFLNNSDTFIITPGGLGTLDEFFEIITLKKLKRHEKSIIIFNIDRYFNKMLEMLDEMDQKGFLYENDNKLVKIASSIDEVFNYL